MVTCSTFEVKVYAIERGARSLRNLDKDLFIKQQATMEQSKSPHLFQLSKQYVQIELLCLHLLSRLSNCHPIPICQLYPQ